MFLRFTSCALNGPPLGIQDQSQKKSKTSFHSACVTPWAKMAPPYHLATLIPICASQTPHEFKFSWSIPIGKDDNEESKHFQQEPINTAFNKHGATRPPASSACSPKTESNPTLLLSELPPCPLRCPAGRPSLPMQQLFPSLAATHPPSSSQLCRPVASQPVEEGLGLHLPYQKHIWKLASLKIIYAWRLPVKQRCDLRPSCS